jgi:DNA-binding IclR family transcriptional regulator
MLFCFDLKHPQLWLVHINQRLGLHKSTVHRLLSMLKKKGLVMADASSQLYSLGPALVELAGVVLRQQDLRALSRLPMEDLRWATNETLSLHIRMADTRVCVEELERVLPTLSLTPIPPRRSPTWRPYGLIGAPPARVATL